MAFDGFGVLSRADGDADGGERLADLDPGSTAGGATERGDALDELHFAVEGFVDQGGVGDGPVGEVDGLGEGCVDLGGEVAPDVLGQVRSHWGEQFGQRREHGVQGLVGAALGVEVGGCAASGGGPEAAPAASDVPIGERVDEAVDFAGGHGRVVVVECVGDATDQRVEFADDPAVQFDGRRRRIGIRSPAVDVGVGDEEGVGVPEGVEESALGFADQAGGEASRVAGRRGDVAVPAQRVGAALVEDGPGVDDVALGLGHLLAGLVEDVTERDHVAERDRLGHGLGAVEHGGLGVERVEPASGLVDGFADEVGGESLVEAVLVLEGVVPLGVGHRAGVEPGVGDFGAAARGATALLAADLDLVDEGPMRIGEIGLDAAERLRALAQFVEGADAGDVAAFGATPERQRRAPVALAADGPVDVVGQPVAVASGAGVLGMPVD